MHHHRPFRSYFLLSLIIASSFLFGACRKYSDGPNFSFIPREARIANNWQGESISRNTIQEVTLYETYSMNFLDNGVMLWTTKKVGEDLVERTGKWRLASADEEIELEFDAANSPTGETRLLFLEIRRLTSNNMWVNFFWENDEWEVQLN